MFASPLQAQVLQGLILDEAIAAIECNEPERQQFWQQLQQIYPVWLQQEGMTPAQFAEWMERELKIRKFQRKQWGRILPSYFLQRKAQLDQVICSLICLRDRDLAQELYFRIVEGEQSFAEVARHFSQPQSARPLAQLVDQIAANGLVEPLELGKLPPQLARLFYGARPGQLWPPTAIGEWTVIAQLEAWLPIQLNETIEQTLFNELLEQWLQKQVQQRFAL